MPYNATDNWNSLDEFDPDGSSEAGSILDDALRETRLVAKTTMKLEHNGDGSHKTGIITQAHLAADSVGSSEIQSGAVDNSELASNAVSASKIQSGAVTEAKIGSGAVTADKIGSSAVTTAKIQDQAATLVKLFASVGTGGRLPVIQADGSIEEKAVTGVIAIDEDGVTTLPNNLFPVALLSHTVATGTDGGGFTSGADVVRALSSEDVDSDSIVSLSANQVTFAGSGTYLIMGWSLAHEVGAHRARIMDVTGTPSEHFVGTSEVAYFGSSKSHFMGVITVAASDKLSIYHRCETTKATDGFGKAHSFGEDEKYAEMFIMKLS